MEKMNFGLKLKWSIDSTASGRTFIARGFAGAMFFFVTFRPSFAGNLLQCAHGGGGATSGADFTLRNEWQAQ